MDRLTINDVKKLSKMRLKFVFLLFFLWIISKSFATEQAYDVITHNDTVYVIYSLNILEARDYPFEPYIGIFLKDTLNQHKFDKFNSIGADGNPSSSYIIHFLKSTGWCLRGYVGNWEIQNDSLILKSITSGLGKKIDLDYLFENRDTRNGVLADWYSGILRVIPSVVSYYSWHDTKSITYIFGIENGIVKVKHKRNRETD